MTCVTGYIRILFAAAAVMTGSWFLASTSNAATWDGGGSDGNWMTAANWVGDIAPAPGDILQFAGTTNLVTNNDFASNTLFGGLGFSGGAGSFTLGGNAMILGGDINQSSSASETINFTTATVTSNAISYLQGGLVLDGATSNVNVTGGGSLSLGQVTFGAAPKSANVSTLNINNSVSASGLSVQTKSVSPDVINIASGQTFTVGGTVNLGTMTTVTGEGNLNTNVNFTGGGNFSVTGGNFYVGLGSNNFGSADRNVARVDMTALTNFSYTGGANFGVGWMTRPDGQLRLASGSNTIVAATMEIGSSGKTGTTASDNNSGTTARLFLGTGTNTINAGQIDIGNIKGVGVVDWQGSTGSVTIAGQTGGASTANITVGRQSSATGSSTASQLLLAGHNAIVQAGTVIVGHLNGATSATATGQITFDTGTFNVNTLQIGRNQSGNDPNGVNGTFTLGTNASSTGTLTVNTAFSLGNDNSSSNVPTVATFIVNGGTADIKSDIQVIAAGTLAADQSTLTLNNGTINMNGKNIGSYASPVKTINLNGGSLTNAALIAGTAINVNSAASVTGSPVYLIADAGTLTAASGLTLASGTQLQGGGATGAGQINGDVTAASGSIINPGTTNVPATLQFNNNLTLNGGSTLHYDLSNNALSGNDLITVGGNLNLAGTVNLDFGALGTGAQTGNTYTLINYFGTLTGNETNFTPTTGGTRMTFTVQPTASTPGSVQVLVGGTGPLALTWIGNVNNNWDLVGAANWRDPSLNPQQFYNLDTVTFDDTSTNLNAVQIVGSVQPGSVTVNATRNYTFAGAGSIVGSAVLTKQGSGTLTVTNANSYTGGTQIQAGVVQIGNGGTLGSGSVANDGTLTFNRTDTSTFANTISGSGSVNHVGSGTTTVSGTNTYTGATTISAGTLKATTGASTGDTTGAALTVASGATFDIGGNTTANNFNLGAKTVHISGNGVGGTAGALANSGGAVQNNAFNNITLDADALIAGARMDIGRTATVGTRTLDLANHTLTVNMSGSQPIFSILDGVTVTAGNIVVAGGGLNIERSSSVPATGGTITFNSGTVLQTFQSAAGSVTRPMVFKGNNIIGSGSTTAATINSPMQLQGNVTLQPLASGVPSTANNPLTLAGDISESGGSFGITKLGPNTATLTGNLSYTGNTTVSEGTLSLSPVDTTSELADTSTVSIAASAFLDLSFSNTDTISSLILGGSTAQAGTWGSLSSGAQFTSALLTGTGLLNVTGAGLAGDYNSDGKVDAADYVMWRKNPGAFGGDPAGYTTWRANFGAGSGSGAAANQSGAVPEPGAILLALCAICGAVFLRSRGVR